MDNHRGDVADVANKQMKKSCPEVAHTLATAADGAWLAISRTVYKQHFIFPFYLLHYQQTKYIEISTYREKKHNEKK